MSETSQRAGTSPSSASWLRRVPPRAWGALVLIVLAVIFIVENRDPAAVRLIVPIVVMPLWAALAAMFVVGLLVGLGLARRRR